MPEAEAPGWRCARSRSQRKMAYQWHLLTSLVLTVRQALAASTARQRPQVALTGVKDPIDDDCYHGTSRCE